MGNPLPAINSLTVAPIERDKRVAASRYVLRKARSPEDLRLLLDALGLSTPAPKEGTDA